jgi:hypothetical protein
LEEFEGTTGDGDVLSRSVLGAGERGLGDVADAGVAI